MSSSVGWTVVSMVVGFVFGWWDVSDRLQDSLVVEPVDPFQGDVFDVVESFPWSFAADEFGLVETVDRLSYRGLRASQSINSRSLRGRRSKRPTQESEGSTSVSAT